MSTEILAADQFDAAALCDAMAEAFADYLIGPLAMSPAQWPMFLRRQGVQLALSRVIVADGRVLAFALVAPRPGRSRLATMGARPSARGAGHAPALLDRVIAEARARGDQAIELEVFERNARALALYRGRGFVPIAELHGYSRAPAPATPPLTPPAVIGADEALALLQRLPDSALPYQQTADSLAAAWALAAPGAAPRAWQAGQAVVVFSDADLSRVMLLALADPEPGQRGARLLAQALAARYPTRTLRMPQLLRPDLGGQALAEAGWQREPLHQLLMRMPLQAAPG